MHEELLNRAADAVTLAQQAGADAAWATASRRRSVEFSFRDDRLEKVQEAVSRSLGLQLYVAGRYSTHTTTDLVPERLERFIREAVAMTRAIQVDPYRQITDPALFEGRSDLDLDLVDPRLEQLDNSTREEWCRQMVEAGRQHERVISVTSSISSGHGIVVDASSNGFTGTAEGTAIWLSTGVTLQDEGERRPEGAMWAGGRHLEGLPLPREIGSKALSEAVRRLGATTGPTQVATLVVDPRAAGGLLGHLLRPASAALIHQGRSFWADAAHRPLASERLDLTDNPLLVRGLASRRYDGEGIAARVLPIVQAGRVANLYVDTYYGRKTGMAPTTGGSSNLVVTLGERSCDELIAAVGRGIYVTSWLGGNSDTTTGDFSLGFRGHAIENGAVGAPLGEMNVSGNLVELFSNLVEVGNDPWPYSSYLTPTLVFENVQFSGT
ncbi:MAG: TldD/PmbA family protein [Bradymonadales bacterium]|nr:TldD/PmbA family protein [Bradymonadales bacterium]